MQLASLDRDLGSEDYREAVLHCVWAVERQTRERLLLCAAIELLPHEVPAEVMVAERCARISKRFFVYASAIILSTERALAWFEEAKSAAAARPNADGFLTTSVFSGMQTLVQEPDTASFVATNIAVPFLAQWHGSARVRHLVPQRDAMHDWTAEERSGAISWIKQEAHVDLALFPEFVGSVHLIAPNPIFRSVFVRYEKEPCPALIVAITPRRGQNLCGLLLLVEERRATGTGVLACVTIEQPTIRLELPYQPGEIRERVIDPKRGLLHDGHFGVFGVGFSTTIDMASRVRRVVPEDPADAYEVPIVGDLRTVSNLPPSVPEKPASQLLHLARIDRQRRARGAAEQKWFRDRVPDAVQALRELVGKATESVFVCDPYFGGNDLLRVLLAIADPSTPVRILAGAAHLRRPSEAPKLSAALTTAKASPPCNPIEVRVMQGKAPAIHDRFIAIGEKMWSLGASINNYGERGTLLVAVPDPQPVRQDLESVWDASAPFEQWLAKRP